MAGDSPSHAYGHRRVPWDQVRGRKKPALSGPTGCPTRRCEARRTVAVLRPVSGGLERSWRRKVTLMGGAESHAPDCPPVWKGKWPKLRKY